MDHTQTKVAYLAHKPKIAKNVTTATDDKNLSFERMLDISLYEAFAVGYEVNQEKINEMLYFIEELLPSLAEEPKLQMAYGLALEFLRKFKKLKSENYKQPESE
jgi:hypothetical protein